MHINENMYMIKEKNVYLVTLFILISIIRVKSERYFISQEGVNWYQALINCKNIGMELLSIHTEEENKDLAKHLYFNKHKRGYWLAGINEGDGQYYWATTGTKIIFTHWLKGQPDNATLAINFNNGEHCIQWGKGDTNPQPMGWNDVCCDTLLPYICYKPEYCHRDNDLI